MRRTVTIAILVTLTSIYYLTQGQMVYLKTDAFLDLTSVSFAHSLGVVINIHLILLGVKGKLD